MSRKSPLIASALLLGSSLFFSSLTEAASRWASLSQCNAYASEVRPHLPQQIDEVTIWTSADCDVGGAGVIARFGYSLLIPDSQAYPKKIKDAVHDRAIAMYCNTPQLRNFLNDVDVEMLYARKDGKFITSFRVTKDVCQ